MKTHDKNLKYLLAVLEERERKINMEILQRRYTIRDLSRQQHIAKIEHRYLQSHIDALKKEYAND